MEKTGLKHTRCSKLTDQELVSLAINKNESAFLELFNRYKDGLKLHVGKIIPSWDVEDICMQSFLKAFLHDDSFDKDKGEFRTWLYTIGWNTALDHLGQKKRENSNMPTTELAEDGPMQKIVAPEKSPEEQISYQEDYEKLMKYIQELDDKYREIAIDRFINDCEYSEIAEKYDLPVNTVKTRIKRSKERLQKMMETSDDLL